MGAPFTILAKKRRSRFSVTYIVLVGAPHNIPELLEIIFLRRISCPRLGPGSGAALLPGATLVSWRKVRWDPTPSHSSSYAPGCHKKTMLWRPLQHLDLLEDG